MTIINFIRVTTKEYLNKYCYFPANKCFVEKNIFIY